MLDKITRNWWLYGLRGLAAVIFGVLALIWPEQAKVVLVLLFGAYVLVDGSFAAIAGVALHRYVDLWWAVLLEGVAGIVIGLLTFIWPNVTGLVLLYFIAAWALITGIFEVWAAIQLRRLIPGEWALILSGLLSILFGVLLFVFPGVGAVGLVWLIGLYAILNGISLIVLAFGLHGLRRDLETGAETGFDTGTQKSHA